MALNPLLKKLVTQSAAKYKGGNAKLSKLKEGRNVLRIIAPGMWQGQPEVAGTNSAFHRELGVHWIKASSDGKPLVVVGSEEICYGRISPVSAAIDAAIASAYDEDSKKLYEEWKARRSIILNVVNRDAGDEVQTLELSATTFGKIMDLISLYDDSDVNVVDHAAGNDIVITRTGKGLGTNYDVAIVPLAPGRSFKAVTAEQVNQAADLDAFIAANYFRGEEQKALNAIVQISGISMPASISNMTVGASTPVAALTSSGATVAGATVAAVASAAVAQDQMQAEVQRQVAMILAQQQQQAAAAAAATLGANVAAQVQTKVMTADTAMSDLGQDEQDNLLAMLNNIGN